MLSFIRQTIFTIVDALGKEAGWLVANLVGMLAPIFFEMWLTTPRSEWEELNGIDVIYAWITKVFPVLFIFFLVNILWLSQVCRRHRGLARRRAFGVCLLVCCLWLVPLCLNPVFFGLCGEAIRMIDGEAWHH